MFKSVSEMIVWFIIGWAIWPGTFFLVALIGESRMPPLWKRQSKAFFPGDLTLPVMWIAMLKINLNERLSISSSTSIISRVVIVIIEIVIFHIVTKVVKEDRSHYSDRAANSPTKIYHDLVGYYIFPLSITPLVVFYVAKHIENHVGLSWSLLWVILPLAFYVLCVMCDVRKSASPEDIEVRHPSDWQPIWKTQKR